MEGSRAQDRSTITGVFLLSDFIQVIGTGEKRLAALELARWPAGFRCQRFEASEKLGVIHYDRRKRYQRNQCRHQMTATAGTIIDSTKLPLAKWFQAIYLITHTNNGISAMGFKKQHGFSYPTSWLLNISWWRQ